MAAPVDRVWAVTVDVERWPEWTPTVEHAERLDDGAFRVGSTARLRQPRLPEAEWRVTALAPGRSFTWENRARGSRTAATHELAATKDGGTAVTLRVELSGLPAWLMWPLIRSTVRRYVEEEAEGLKARCEAAEEPA